MVAIHSNPPEKLNIVSHFFNCRRDQQIQGFGGGKLVHFPVLLPLPVGLPSLGPAGGGDLWEMPAGVLQDAPQNVGDLDFLS